MFHSFSELCTRIYLPVRFAEPIVNLQCLLDNFACEENSNSHIEWEKGLNGVVLQIERGMLKRQAIENPANVFVVGRQYHVQSVVQHVPLGEGRGHYVAYVRRGDAWIAYDDESTSSEPKGRMLFSMSESTPELFVQATWPALRAAELPDCSRRR